MPVYVTASGQYYAAGSPNNPADQLKPFVSQTLLDLLTSSPTAEATVVLDLTEVSQAAQAVESAGTTTATVQGQTIANSILQGVTLQAVTDTLQSLGTINPQPPNIST